LRIRHFLPYPAFRFKARPSRTPVPKDGQARNARKQFAKSDITETQY
jgi:hypothetical protein